MSWLWSHENLLTAELLAIVAVVLRMLASGLHLVYRVFFVYLLVSAVQLAIPWFLPSDQMLYMYLYVGTEFIVLCLYALIVLEMWSLILHDLNGIAKLARQYVKNALAIAIGASLVLMLFSPAKRKFFGEFLLFERTVVFSLILFVFLITAFLVYYPVPLSRNLIWYSLGYACFFTGKVVALFLRYAGPDWKLIATRVVLANSIAWLVCLAIVLNRYGERRTVVLGHKWNREDEEKVLNQLKSLNSALLRTRK